ncbi:unnamed protein product [Adineta ricciae]|uniref:Uncharacterized protein n=1 Tax=Adineta ricciae TaxID=249248 RepID=A0A815EM96_ADIRI|nr:unnamed protein product [Adineta ricciae]CAF1507465.1 unnamed protein product [Adineta ricciae]
MTSAMSNETIRRSLVKRQFMKWNIGGHETNPSITGSNNKVFLPVTEDIKEQETLLRRAGDQVGKILEGGTSVVLAPAKWLSHMQENWYALLIALFLKPILCGN